MARGTFSRGGTAQEVEGGVNKAQQNIQDFLSSLTFDAFDWDTACSTDSAIHPGSLCCEPTPEQLHDDGRIDGIPIITPEQWAEREQRYRAEEERIAAMLPETALNGTARGGWKKTWESGRPYIRIRRSDGEKFPSAAAAARSVGGNTSMIMKCAKEGKRYRGYVWRVLKEAA
jgi:hypothetical protein